MWTKILLAIAVTLFLLACFVIHVLFIAPRFDPLQKLCGPPETKLFGTHIHMVLDPFVSYKTHESYVEKYGRNVRVRGLGPWDERLLTLDPISLGHVLKNSTIYEKPWQSRRLITGLIGCGMLSAEGAVHKRQRRVATPAFSNQNMKAVIPVAFRKSAQLKDRWMEVYDAGVAEDASKKVEINVVHWINRATIDVIGLAGFGYNFDSVKDETNELFCAYRDMFEVAISQGTGFRTILGIYFPFTKSVFKDYMLNTVDRCQEVIHRVAGELIQDRKRTIEAGKSINTDILTLLLKSNIGKDIPEEQKMSDEEVLHSINTFLFAGSDSSSLSISWTLHLLAQHPHFQTRLRAELLSVGSRTASMSDLSDEEIESLHSDLAKLPFLHNIIRESLRLIPAVHSSIRVATKDDIIPTKYPARYTDGTSSMAGVKIKKGSFVHVPVEAFNLDRGVWGQDAWEFVPDRWEELPGAVLEQPGLFDHILTFSAGPRSCIGMKFSIVEIKAFLYILITNFVFTPTGAKINKENVVLTRPYVAGKFSQGSQLPLNVVPYHGEDDL